MLSLQVNSNEKLLLGSIQLPSFLGKSEADISKITEKAASDAFIFAEKGFHGVFIQDTTPGNLTMDTIANLAAITAVVKDRTPGFSIGSQMECDDAKAILATAKAAACDMVRIKNFIGASIRNSGLINGQGPEAVRYKIENKVDALIFSDIFNLTGVPLGTIPLKTACSMAIKLGVSALIICGPDYMETIRMIKEVKNDFPETFVICGGNSTPDNVHEILSLCDGVIVSSCLKTNKAFDQDKMKRFIDNAHF